MAGGQNIQGVNAPLTVNTAEAFAQLRSLHAYAQRVRASMHGLPAVGGMPSGSKHVLLSQPPSGGIPGSKADEMRAQTRFLPSYAGRKGVSKHTAPYAVPVHIPDDPVTAAPARNRPAGGQGGGNANVAGGAATATAMDRHLQKVRREASGVQIERGGVKLGGLVEVGAGGVAMKSAFTKALGPAAVFTAIAYAGLKAAAVAGEGMESLVAESLETGKPLSAVVLEHAKYAPARLAGAVIEGGLGLFFDAIGGTGKVGSALFSDNSTSARANQLAYGQVISDAKQSLADSIAAATGGKQHYQMLQDRFKQDARVRDELVKGAIEQSMKDAAKTAEQLLGMGFPGTLDELKAAGGPVQRAYETHRTTEALKQYEDWKNNEGKDG